MRQIKEYDERRNEILNSAEALFHSKGYSKCTVNDILKEVSIAKGTFYYYFKSKEEVMDAIVTRYSDVIVHRVEDIVTNQKLQPQEKLMQVFLSMNVTSEIGDDMLEEMHKAENALFHQKTLVQMTYDLIEPLMLIIQEGTKQGIWNCRFPKEYMQIFLVSALTLTDEGMFMEEGTDSIMLIKALLSLLEKMLEVEENLFLNSFMEHLSKG